MNRILIIRSSAIGDIVMASPVIDALRRAIPGAFIAWLADPSVVPLLEHDPRLDRVIVWSRNRWATLSRGLRLNALFREAVQLRSQLRACRFDTAIDIQGLFRSRFMARLSGAPLRIGFRSKEPGEWLMTRIETKGPSTKRMGSEYRFLMTRIGIPVGNFAPAIFLSASERHAAGQRLAAGGIRAPYAVICPFTTRPQKHWVESRWASLTRRIHRNWGWPVVLLGGPGDREAAGRIRAAVDAGLVDLTGALPLAQSAAVVAGAALVVGVDTGLTHMGTAFERPTVALFGPTCPYLTTPSDRTRVIHHPQDCSPCRRSPTCADYRCMAGIGVEEVLRTALEVTGRAP